MKSHRHATIASDHARQDRIGGTIEAGEQTRVGFEKDYQPKTDEQVAGNDDKLFTWIWRTLSGPLAIMAMGAIVEGPVSGTVDNLMARGEPSPEEFAYERQPVAYISMLGMWMLLLLVSAWLFWRVWLSREGAR